MARCGALEKEMRVEEAGLQARCQTWLVGDAAPGGPNTEELRVSASCLAPEEGRPSRSAVEPPAFLVQHRHFGGSAGFNDGTSRPGTAAVDRKVDGVETREMLRPRKKLTRVAT